MFQKAVSPQIISLLDSFELSDSYVVVLLLDLVLEDGGSLAFDLLSNNKTFSESDVKMSDH
jgi:hypothetical protein